MTLMPIVRIIDCFNAESSVSWTRMVWRLEVGPRRGKMMHTEPERPHLRTCMLANGAQIAPGRRTGRWPQVLRLRGSTDTRCRHCVEDGR